MSKRWELGVEGRRAAHRYVPWFIIAVKGQYCYYLNLAKKERVWSWQPPTACKRAKMKVGRTHETGKKIRPGGNPAADPPPCAPIPAAGGQAE